MGDRGDRGQRRRTAPRPALSGQLAARPLPSARQRRGKQPGGGATGGIGLAMLANLQVSAGDAMAVIALMVLALVAVINTVSRAIRVRLS